MEFNQNNISTISTMIAPFIVTLLASFGINIDQTITIAFIGAIFELILLIWSAKNPNEMKVFGNEPVTEDEDMILNDEYVTGDDFDDQ